MTAMGRPVEAAGGTVPACGDAKEPKTRWLVGPTALALAIAVTLGLRLVLVLTVPDPDMDAYGHYAAARALTTSPRDLSVLWVWLPGWHYMFAAALCPLCQRE